MNAQLQILVEKYINNTCSKKELETFFLLVRESVDDEQLEEVLWVVWEKTKGQNSDVNINWDYKMSLLMEELEEKVPVVSSTTSWLSWQKIAVAASIILVLGIGFWTFNREGNYKAVEIAQDISAPQSNRAMIKLNNGQQVYLDKVAAGTLVAQGNANVIKTVDGKIVYQTNADAGTKMVYNTLINPKGSQVIDITLSDGTKVWLNAGSTLYYPVAFMGKDRKVTINGEGYFEVAHRTDMPFKVSKADMEVTVLGTHFNVKAYDNETDIKVTLLEGSVKTTKQNGQSAKLKPGEQARITNKIEVQKDVDLNEVMAWKKGVFQFKDANIEEIMRQVSRWYDVEIAYEGDVSDLNFAGSVSRQANLSELLKRLEATEMVKFSIKSKKLYVKPQ
ncbi:FecR family protein [Pedobacter borealis]|uniref:FecR family protein n=1 Tax=Pedobacter borealis TaxID=475254 RepID=UPI00068B4B69|nr:FecR family protein [Pedobacter borealis]